MKIPFYISTAASVKNEKMKTLLAKHGYNVQVNKDAPKDAPAPKPYIPSP